MMRPNYFILLMSLLVNAGTVASQASPPGTDAGTIDPQASPPGTDAGIVASQASLPGTDAGTIAPQASPSGTDAGIVAPQASPSGTDAGIVARQPIIAEGIRWPDEVRPLATLDGPAVLAAHAVLQRVLARFPKEYAKDCSFSAKAMDVIVGHEGGAVFRRGQSTRGEMRMGGSWWCLGD